MPALCCRKLGATFRTTPEFWLNAQKGVGVPGG